MENLGGAYLPAWFVIFAFTVHLAWWWMCGSPYDFVISLSAHSRVHKILWKYLREVYCRIAPWVQYRAVSELWVHCKHPMWGEFYRHLFTWEAWIGRFLLLLLVFILLPCTVSNYYRHHHHHHHHCPSFQSFSPSFTGYDQSCRETHTMDLALCYLAVFSELFSFILYK